MSNNGWKGGGADILIISVKLIVMSGHNCLLEFKSYIGLHIIQPLLPRN